MKPYFYLSVFVVITFFTSCNKVENNIFVSNVNELTEALKSVKAGDDIVLKNGTYKDINIKFIGEGTEGNPITLSAETPGEVFIEGESSLEISGNYLKVDGLFFRNGHSPKTNVIAFRTSKKEVANHSTVSNCVILDFNNLQRDQDNLWVQFYGKHNELSNCYLAGKTNGGPTVRVDLKGNQSIRNYHKIINNHFGPRPRKGGARGETIQLGSSFTSMSPSNTTIANNLFEECNGEVEIISSKTNFNIIKNNVFYKSEGSVVTRHGNYVTVDGNYFIGDGVNDQFGGIRIINTGHWVINNLFYKIKGKNFRSPIAIMNGIPKSPLNRYNQVTDVVVAYNTFVDSDSPFQFGVGTNIAQAAVLPKSEIRSARPLRTEVVNNVIYNSVGDKNPIIEHDKADGVTFKSNVIDNNKVEFPQKDGLVAMKLSLTDIGSNLSFPLSGFSDVEPYIGFDFEKITEDLLGNSRSKNNQIGAILASENINLNILDKSKYGTDWYSNEVEKKDPVTHNVTNADELVSKLKAAESGDIINLNDGAYAISKSLIINKSITIQSNNKSEILYSGDENTPALQLQPYGKLVLKNIKLKGTNTQYAFASLKENMSNHFGLEVIDSEISNFNYALKVFKQSFSEEITFTNTAILNCENGLELSEETNDRGDYNTEFLTIDNCTFNNVKQNVIDYYRGGYDESTIGGNLLVTNSTFTNCGASEKNRILINHRGIVNVNINNNVFKNNKVKLVALLWGAKNNSHSNNTVTNSGIIKTEENLKQKLMY
ncbi:alginate lyase [Polaribacter reichenbachii]|uniref:Alginate lyase n=1 Tax=Polaribacter reichenbachii TaxID=996801 RepID=A0A1B8U6J8_9FLAO|nr:chondroitinase-B domain-containing protein [Polaribacter reichenbachii]APZ46122.1 alginate lyase [Polaribacter reichenbachii]AUC19984.1 alginate lyase [Polaribacter reichenbachii]OBY67470.1 alginate lyase [Polaribacter reichenbachii]